MNVIKKSLATLLVLAMALGLVACGGAPATSPTPTPPAQTGAFKAGTYTGTAPARNGDLTVEVVVSADKIESVTVLTHTETAGIADPALTNIPADILAGQGLMVDGVSGATVTGDAILVAVTDCLTQAGGDVEVLKQKGPKKEVLADESKITDVVVVGSGMAGLAAAITAAKAGSKVILLEKMAALGGASITCGGEVLAAGTDMQKAQNIDDSAQALADYWIQVGGDKVDAQKLTAIAEMSADTVDFLMENGVLFDKVTFSYNYPYQNPLRDHLVAGSRGTGLIQPLVEQAKALGIEIWTETPAVSLINEGGIIKGVVAENGGRTLTVIAKSTVLATGGYANSEALMKEYAPAVGAFGTFLGAAADGDGLVMARAAGAEIISNGGAIVNPMDSGPTQFADAGGIMLNVTPAGKRFSNENDYWFARTSHLFFEEGANSYFGLVDASMENETFAAAVEAGTVFKADTIEGLAAQLKMDPAVLVATVNRYNEQCKAGKDDDFGKPAVGLVGSRAENVKEVALLNAIEKAPFYAVSFLTSKVTGTFGGPKTTLNGEVFAVGGQTIPGLYAAGELANGDLFNKQYPCSGSSIQFCATGGRLAGAAAAAYAK